jgi:hypothetical protein
MLNKTHLQAEMTAEKEETLGGGENFKHSFGSVQTGKLEMFLKMYTRYKTIRPELEKKLDIVLVTLLTIFIIINISQIGKINK